MELYLLQLLPSILEISSNRSSKHKLVVKINGLLLLNELHSDSFRGPKIFRDIKLELSDIYVDIHCLSTSSVTSSPIGNTNRSNFCLFVRYSIFNVYCTCTTVFFDIY